MSEGFVGRMLGEKWSVEIWRTDIWGSVCMFELVDVEGVVSKRETWSI
jgi:hypothetical protein